MFMNHTTDVANQMIKCLGKIKSEQIHVMQLKFYTSPLLHTQEEYYRRNTCVQNFLTTRIEVFQVFTPFYEPVNAPETFRETSL